MKFPKTNAPPAPSHGKNAPRLAVSLPGRVNGCLWATSDGRRCRMPCWEAHASLCLFHARQEQQLLDLDRVAAEFASLPGEFKTAGDVHHALSKLLALVANNRIPPRQAATLAYIGRLLLLTLGRVKQEIITARDYAFRERAFHCAVPDRT